MFARHENANPNCPIARAVGSLLDRVLGQAEGAMMQSLKRTTLADLLRSQEVVTQLAGAPVQSLILRGMSGMRRALLGALLAALSSSASKNELRDVGCATESGLRATTRRP